MSKSKKKLRYYLSGIISLIIFLILAGLACYQWIDSYNTRLIELDEYKAGLRDRVEQDPIWQLLYPFGYIPIISLVYGLLEGKKKYRFIIPFITGIVAFIIDYVASDGGKYFGSGLPRKDFLPYFTPAFIFALFGIGINRIIFSIINAFKKKK